MQAVATPPTVPLDDPSLYINRELSWLEFNRRVLEEARDPQVPLLERLKFLAIFASNLDEFFMVRVGGLQQKVQAGIAVGSGADRMPPREQLDRIGQVVHQMVGEQYACLRNDVLPALEREGVVVRGLKDLTDADRKYLRELFNREIFPVLTPLAIDPGHPFPHLLNKSLNLAVLLQRPGQEEKLFAVVQVPSVLPRFVALPVPPGSSLPRPEAVSGVPVAPGGADGLTPRSYAFVALETVIRMHLPDLFAGMQLEHATVFRVTRNSDFEIDDDEVEDLLKAIEEEVRKRRRGAAVRLEIEADAPPETEHFLMGALDLDPPDVYRINGLLDLTGLFQVHALPGFPHLRDPLFVPQPTPEFAQSATPWAAIRARDILLHHPYESFAPVVDFIEAAASDERVLAIKQTLYRTSSDSPVVRALQRAADNGKQVTAVIELKARLDEERNIVWARELEKAGVHVVFGFIGLKTHCKVALVVRREEDGVIRRYVHLGTGNYNSVTARGYEDFGLFTADEDIAADVADLFNYVTGFGRPGHFRKLLVAPFTLRQRLVDEIRDVADAARAGRKARIRIKVNGLTHTEVIDELYAASEAGARIELFVRGVCSLRPGVPGLSENIRVRSVLGRFLEHSRLFVFEAGDRAAYYLGSSDLMPRNLDHRVEVVAPVEDVAIQAELAATFDTLAADNTSAWELHADGTWQRVHPKKDDRIRSAQATMMRRARRRVSLARSR